MNHVVDTNVLIAASAYVAPEPMDATPTDPQLQEQVFNWLDKLSKGSTCVVLDYDYHIFGEYQNKLSHQDYGILLIQQKIDMDQVIWVSVTNDEHGYAILPDELKDPAWDESDKKFGTAAFNAKAHVEDISIVNAADTDWYDVKPILQANNINVHQIIDEWCRSKYLEKKGIAPLDV